MIRDFEYWDQFIKQYVVTARFANEKNVGIRIVWLNAKPWVVATGDVPAGMTEEMRQAP